MMNDILGLGLALATGVGLGAIFFGGLWLTLQKFPTARAPILLALGSLIVRTGIALIGFYLIMDGSWQRLIVAVLGFFLARQFLIRQLQPPQTASAEQQ